LAEQNFFLNILDSDIYKAACDFLSAKIQCYKSVDASFDCITEDVLANVEEILINEEIEKAKNQSDFMGDQYIESCGIITSYKTNVVNQYYGPKAPCTYDEIIEALDTKNTCINDLTQKIAFLESIANSVDSWTQIFCLDKAGRVECQQSVLNCKNSLQREKTEKNDQKTFDEEEIKYREINIAFEDFSYNDCQRGNRISKRHALMKRSLSTEQVEDLIRVFGERSDLMD